MSDGSVGNKSDSKPTVMSPPENDASEGLANKDVPKYGSTDTTPVESDPVTNGKNGLVDTDTKAGGGEPGKKGKVDEESEKENEERKGTENENEEKGEEVGEKKENEQKGEEQEKGSLEGGEKADAKEEEDKRADDDLDGKDGEDGKVSELLTHPEEPAPDYNPPNPDQAPGYSGAERADGDDAMSSTRPPKLTKGDFRKGKKKEAAARCLNWCLGSAMITIFLIVFIIIPVASVVVGGTGINKCEMEPLIPVWMIVFGAVCLLLVVLAIIIQVVARKKYRELKKKSEESGRRTSATDMYEAEYKISFGAAVVFVIIFVFLLAWFICGNIWVFENWQNMDTGEEMCDELTYYFAFAVICLLYILGLILCCICCIVICTAVTTDHDHRCEYNTPARH